MSISIRPYADESDWNAVVHLLATLPRDTQHLVDAPWRLASPAAQDPANGRVAINRDGELTGLAIWQRYWAVLDLYVQPGPDAGESYQRLLDWAPERYRELDLERGRPLPYWVEADEHDVSLLATFDKHGYQLLDDFDYVMLTHSLTEPVPEPVLPPGYSVRSLRGDAEVPAYAELHRLAFDSTSMTAEWRRRTLRSPWYDPRFDIVADAPDGSLAGFCVTWFDPTRRVGQIEPLGVHLDHQQRGIGRALLFEVLQRLRDAGATEAWVETESTRKAAISAYESAGFNQARTIVRRGMWASK